MPEIDNTSARYCASGLFNARELAPSLPHHLAVHLFGIAKKTWSAYKSGQKMLETCERETEISMELPLSKENILVFVAWMINRNLSSSTIQTYLGGLRQKYLQMGLDPSSIRSLTGYPVIQPAGYQAYETGYPA